MNGARPPRASDPLLHASDEPGAQATGPLPPSPPWVRMWLGEAETDEGMQPPTACQPPRSSQHEARPLPQHLPHRRTIHRHHPDLRPLEPVEVPVNGRHAHPLGRRVVEVRRHQPHPNPSRLLPQKPHLRRMHRMRHPQQNIPLPTRNTLDDGDQGLRLSELNDEKNASRRPSKNAPY